MNPQNINKYLSYSEAATFLNVKVSWLKAAVFRRQIPFLKLNRLVRFDEDELRRWLRK